MLKRKSKRNPKRSLRPESLENRRLMTADCIDFEDLALGQQYLNGDTFLADNSGFQADITLEDFTWSTGGTTASGFAEVENGGLAGGAGQELQVNNTLLRFDFMDPVSELTFKYGEYGGNLNIEINGDFHAFENFIDIGAGTPVSNLGGVDIVIHDDPFTSLGSVQLIGNVEQLKIGGQELWVDEFCAQDNDQESRFDFGDAPDSYGTTRANFGPYHTIAEDVHLGRLVDPELDGQPSPNASRDDANGPNDDEDGVKFTSAIVAGQIADVEILASTDGWLNAWADFNQDGTWTPNEQIFDAYPVAAGVNSLNFKVPDRSVTNETTFTRWRFSNTHEHLEPTTIQENGEKRTPNGEVEDHPIVIRDGQPEFELDYGDAPDSYRTTAANSGPAHRIQKEVYLGRGVDAEPDGQPSPTAMRDDSGIFDDEDGVKFASPLVAGELAKVEVIASVDGWLNAWIDFNQNGSWSPGEKIFDAQPVMAGANILTFAVPADSVTNELTHSRWRFSTEVKSLPHHGDLPGLGNVNGEVEDHALRIEDRPQDIRADFGDAPDRYRTLLSSNGPRHEIDPQVYLGKSVDAEPNGQPSAGAVRDDLNTTDDEDGVRFLTPMLPGTDAKVEITASEDGWLNAWVDFNRDGTFDPTSEAIATAELITAGTTTLTFPVPDVADDPNSLVYSRFRFSSDTKVLGPAGVRADGNIPNGEVEDYAYLNGDLDGDLDRDINDVDIMSTAIKKGTGNLTDLNCDGVTDQADMDLLIDKIFETYAGDTDLDGDVDFADFLKVSSNFGKSPDASWADGDFDSDCEVSFADFLMLSGNFGKS